MPRIPPTVFPTRDHREKKETPKSVGIYPPINDPIITPIQTRELNGMSI